MINPAMKWQLGIDCNNPKSLKIVLGVISTNWSFVTSISGESFPITP